MILLSLENIECRLSMTRKALNDAQHGIERAVLVAMLACMRMFGYQSIFPLCSSFPHSEQKSASWTKLFRSYDFMFLFSRFGLHVFSQSILGLLHKSEACLEE